MKKIKSIQFAQAIRIGNSVHNGLKTDDHDGVVDEATGRIIVKDRRSGKITYTTWNNAAWWQLVDDEPKNNKRAASSV